MNHEYVEQRDGGYYVAGARVSLDSIVCCFRDGLSPEAIHREFPSLKPAQIYGAIAFYLDHQDEIDHYIEAGRQQFESAGVPISESNPALWARIQQARAKMGETRP